MNVKTIKVVGGDELIGTLVSMGELYITMSDVVIFQQMQHPDGKVMHSFGNWPALAKTGQEVRIPYSALLTYPSEPHEELERQYVSNVTGLELPPVAPQILLS